MPCGNATFCLFPLKVHQPLSRSPSLSEDKQLAYGVCLYPSLTMIPYSNHSTDPLNARVSQSFTSWRRIASNSSIFSLLLPCSLWVSPLCNPPPRNSKTSTLHTDQSVTQQLQQFSSTSMSLSTLLILPISLPCLHCVTQLVWPLEAITLSVLINI